MELFSKVWLQVFSIFSSKYRKHLFSRILYTILNPHSTLQKFNCKSFKFPQHPSNTQLHPILNIHQNIEEFVVEANRSVSILTKYQNKLSFIIFFEQSVIFLFEIESFIKTPFQGISCWFFSKITKEVLYFWKGTLDFKFTFRTITHVLCM